MVNDNIQPNKSQNIMKHVPHILTEIVQQRSSDCCLAKTGSTRPLNEKPQGTRLKRVLSFTGIHQ